MFFDSLWRYEKAQQFFHLTKQLSPTGYDLQSAQAEPTLQAADIGAYEFNKLALHCLERRLQDRSERGAKVSVESLPRAKQQLPSASSGRPNEPSV